MRKNLNQLLSKCERGIRERDAEIDALRNAARLAQEQSPQERDEEIKRLRDANSEWITRCHGAAQTVEELNGIIRQLTSSELKVRTELHDALARASRAEGILDMMVKVVGRR